MNTAATLAVPSANLQPHLVRRSLPRHWSVILQDARDVTVQVDHGTVWMTLEHDTRDIVLDEGGTFRIPRQGRTIITAHTPSRLTFVSPPGVLARWLSRLWPGIARRVHASYSRMEQRWEQPIPLV